MLKPDERIHFIGIGGTGLSAIARVLHESGFRVSGSDRQASPLSDALREAGVAVFIGHDPANVAGATIVVRSSAVPEDNVEVVQALALGVPVLKRSGFLGRIMTGKTAIAVAGAHGKTTTTAMVAWMLAEKNLDPTFIAGGVVQNLGTNAHAGHGPHFVIEADEYDRMFLGLKPDIAVITNVEHDHPDLFPTEESFFSAFEAFVDRISPDGTLVVWGDEGAPLRMRERAARAGIDTLTYGLTPDVDLQAVRLAPVEGAGFEFEVLKQGVRLGKIALQIPGEHNVLNSLAAGAVGDLVGLPFEDISASLGKFSGVGRRFDVRGEAAGVTIIDDYAHHPTEIRATIAAARARYPGRPLWVAWQPHTYSRLRLLCGAFAGSFEGADHVVVTGVYAARETAPPDFSLSGLLAAMQHPDASRIEGLEETAEFLRDRLQPGSVLLVLSAGDADQVSEWIYEQLSKPGLDEALP